MAQRQQIRLRGFLCFTAAAAGGMLLGRASAQGVEPITCASNSHFWYRLQPPGPYIDSQRGNKAFGREVKALVLSDDNGRTWPRRLAFPKAQHLSFSHILKNGNVLFAAGAKLYVSTDKLKTCKQVSIKDPEGADYIPRTPKTPTIPDGTSTRFRAYFPGTSAAKNDTGVPPDNSRDFVAAMKAHHVPVEYLELPSGGHGLNGCKGPLWEEWKARSLAWLAARNVIAADKEARR
jgi:hypothetical protein